MKNGFEDDGSNPDYDCWERLIKQSPYTQY